MKVALILPKGIFSSRNNELENFWKESKEMITYRHLWSGFSPALLVVAALLPTDCQITLIDENFEDIDFEERYDLVGITAMTQRANRAYQIADEFRKKGTKVILGGIHPTILPEEAKQHADAVLIGEAEEIFSNFIRDFLKNSIKSFYKTSQPVDITRSPLPRYDLLKPENYNMIWIQTTRGCPIDCEFCAASKVYGLKFRHKAVGQVIKEVSLVKRIWNNALIGFSDDNMFINRKYAKEMLEELAHLNIRWITQTDISIAGDKRFLRLLRKSGCMMLFIGFESLSENTLKSVDTHGWKSKFLPEYKFLIREIQSYGIGVMGAFIVGFDNDDVSVFDKIADFVLENNLYGAQVTILTPLPGTRLRVRLERENRLLTTGWDNYTFLDVNFKPAKMSINELLNGLIETYKKIYNKEVHIKKAKYFKSIFTRLMVKKDTGEIHIVI